MNSDHHRKKIPFPLPMLFTFFLFPALLIVPRLTSRCQPQEIYTTTDPCYPVNQVKKYWREHYGQEAAFLQCIPLQVVVEWDIEENYTRHVRAGDDRIKLLLRDEFPAYLELNYDQENLKRLEAFNILGPSPCCPGKVDYELVQVDASLLACYGGGENCRQFTTSDTQMFQITPQTDNFFSFTWREDTGSRSGDFGSSRIELHPSALPASMSTRRGIGGIQHGSPFEVHVGGLDSIGWEEIQTGIEEGEFHWEFPIDVHKMLPANHSYSQKGKAKVTIEFSEEEEEIWIIMVEGWEKDTTQPPISYQDPSGALKSLPVEVNFQWQLQGEFTIAKRKQKRRYKEGHIILAIASPGLIFDEQTLYRCEQVECQDQTDTATMLEGAFIDGILTGNSVRLTWRPHSPNSCVLCTPRVSFIKKAPFRQQFTSREFLHRISQETLPLRDGYSVSGGSGNWLRYTIKLVKLE